MTKPAAAAMTSTTSTDEPRPNSSAIVARNTAAGLAARVGLKILGLAFNVFVVRSLGAAHFGQYSAVIAYVGLFSVFGDLGVVSYATREISEQPLRVRELVPDMIAMRLLVSLIIIVAAPLSAYWLGRELTLVKGVALASLGLLVYGVQGPLHSALTARERLDSLAAFSVVSQLSFWTLAILLLVLGGGYIGLIVASLAGAAVDTLLSGRMIWKMRVLTGSRIGIQRWSSLFLGSLPFAVSAISFSIVQRFSQAFMAFHVADSQLGFYGAAYSLIAMIMFFPQSFSMALYPTLIRELYVESSISATMIRRSTVYLVTMAVPFAVGGALLADRAILQIYGPEFIESAIVFRYLMLSIPAMFILELLGRVSAALHLERSAAKINVISASLTVLLSVWLIPRLGIVGGAIALFASEMLRLAWLWWLIGTVRLLADWWILIRIAGAAAIMGVGVWAIRDIPLPFLVLIGAGLYGLAVLGLQIVSVRELVHLRHILLRQTESLAS